jgi:hypothetical protein
MAEMKIEHILARQPIIDRVSTRIAVVREDLLPGGSKMRFLPYVVGDAKHIVFGGPFCGGAPYALSVLGRFTGKKITLFYAKRAQLHARQAKAIDNGAELRFVDPGYMTNVQAKAREFAAQSGALFLPLGFDVPQAVEPFVAFMERIKRSIGSPEEIWCATGSGMLARCLGTAFPDSRIMGVAVGLKSRHDAQQMPPNVHLVETRYKFEEETKASSPFPSCRNYDRKAWEQAVRSTAKSILFWNVMG